MWPGKSAFAIVGSSKAGDMGLTIVDFGFTENQRKEGHRECLATL